MFFGFSGFTATAVSFWDCERPKNPGALWFVHSWLTRTLVPESTQPPDVVDWIAAAALAAAAELRAPTSGVESGFDRYRAGWREAVRGLQYLSGGRHEGAGERETYYGTERNGNDERSSSHRVFPSDSGAGEGHGMRRPGGGSPPRVGGPRGRNRLT